MSTQDNIARVEDVTEQSAQSTQQSAQSTQQSTQQSAQSTQQSTQQSAQSTQQSTQQSAQSAQEFFNLGEVVRSINSQYEREFPKLTFNTPQQITDGCVAEFIDASMGVTVATARVRVRNRLIINNENGEMFLQVQLSDLSFSRPSVPVSLKK